MVSCSIFRTLQPGAASTFTRAGITGRVRIESGDFFKELPPGADAIIMKHIIHDWDDDSARRILQACHRALGPRGKVLIVDPVVPSGNAPHYGKLLDLEMLVLTPLGRERTKAEFARLLRGAGFRLSGVIATHSPLSIVEAPSRRDARRMIPPRGQVDLRAGSSPPRAICETRLLPLRVLRYVFLAITGKPEFNGCNQL